MRVKELIEELSKYDPEYRVVLSSHGSYDIEEEYEILGCSEQKVYDEDEENVIETVVELYEY